MREYIMQVISFLVFSSVLNNVVCDNSYKKYIRLFTGVLLIIIVISPVVKIGALDESFINDYIDKSAYTDEINEMSEKIEDMSDNYEKDSIESIIKIRLGQEDIEVRKVEVKYKDDEVYKINVATRLNSRERKEEIKNILSEYMQIPVEYVEVR